MAFTHHLARRLQAMHGVATALVVLTISHTSVAVAQSNASTPRLTIVAGTPAGGGNDIFARLVSRHIGRFLPGNPGTVVQNMPGAGSLIAANWIANSAPRDGSVIVTLPSGVLFEAILGNAAARFDARKFNLIGSLNKFTSVAAVWHTAPVSSAQDLLTHEVLVGASAATSNNSVVPNLLNSLVHTKFKIVHGYDGGVGVSLAMERGEVQAAVGGDWDFIKAMKPDWLRDKKIRILLQTTLSRHRDLADVPTAMELVNDDNRDVLALLIARQSYSGLFLAPPDAPAPVIEALRAGFSKMVDDADFKKDVEQNKLTIDPSGSEEVNQTLGKLLASSQPVIDRASAELRKLTSP